MNEDLTPAEQPAPRRRLKPVTVVAASSIAGLVLGFGGIASAQTADPAPSPSTTAPSDTDEEKKCDKEKAAEEAAADTAADAA